VEKSGLGFSTVSTARHFHGQALDSGHFGENAVLGTTYKVYFTHFSETAPDAYFSRFLRSRLFRGFDLFHLSLPQKRILMDPCPRVAAPEI
jgi:hypothetical protein